MSNKMSNKAQEYTGKAKEFVGEKMDNPRLANDGRRDQVEAHAKQAGNDLKKAADRGRDALQR
jgi:uncharacterized protein YjbJ (UPF0337 family)